MLKKIICGLLLLVTPLSEAARPNATLNTYFPNQNLLDNPGFENGKTKWTASGGTFTTTTTAANVGSGGAAGSWDSSGAAQTWTSTAVTIPAGLYAQNALLYCNIQTPSGTATHTVGAYDGSNLLSSTTVTSSTAYTRTSVNFIMPSSGTIAVRFTSVNANEPAINVDDCYLGSASNMTNVSQAQFIGSAYIAGAASCTWSVTNSSYADFATTSACLGPTVELNPGPGVIQTTDTDLPQFTVNNLPPGNYEIKISASNVSASATAFNGFRISDGTTTSGDIAVKRGDGVTGTQATYLELLGHFNYTTSANRTFKVQCDGDGSNACSIAANSTNDASNTLRFSIVRFPSQNDLAVTLDNSSSSGQVSIAGTANCEFQSTSSSYADFAADSDCSAGYTYKGSASAPTTANTPGATFTNIPAGRYLAYATGFFNHTSASATAAECMYRLYDGTNQISSSSTRTNIITALTAAEAISSIMGVVDYSSFQSSLQLRVQALSVSGSPTCQISDKTTGNQFVLGLIPITQSLPLPQVLNNVASPASGGVRVASAFITNSGTPAVSRQDGNWITSVTDNGTGNNILVIPAGTFSVAPNCMGSLRTDGYATIAGTPSTTSVNMLTRDATGSTIDADFFVICVGAK